MTRLLQLLRGGRSAPDPAHREKLLDRLEQELCPHERKKVTLVCDECGKKLDELEVADDVPEEGA